MAAFLVRSYISYEFWHEQLPPTTASLVCRPTHSVLSTDASFMYSCSVARTLRVQCSLVTAMWTEITDYHGPAAVPSCKVGARGAHNWKFKE